MNQWVQYHWLDIYYLEPLTPLGNDSQQRNFHLPRTWTSHGMHFKSKLITVS